MFADEDDYLDDAFANPVTLAQYEFRISPLILSQSIVDGLAAIKLSGKVDYTIGSHLWLAEYLQAGMILLGVEEAVPFLTTDIDKCIQIFSDAMKLFDGNH
jgi:hypothetical protein